MKINHHKKIALSITILLLLIIISVISLSTSSHALTTTHYTLSSTTISSLRIVQLTDLHNSEFGEENSRLIDAVRAQSPDLILLTGDLLNSDEQRMDIATNLIAKLCDIAPVYFSNGNHEIEYEERYGVDIDGLYREAGAVEESTGTVFRENIWRLVRRIRRKRRFWRSFRIQICQRF